MSMDSQSERKICIPNSEAIDRLFQYEDYRTFLKDFFEEQKQFKKMFSHRYFAYKAGFSSSSTVLKVIKGQTNLTDQSIKKIAKGIGMDNFSASYFKNLVHFNQVKNPEEKKKYRENLNALRKRTSFYHINKNQVTYFEKWYYPVIREIVHYHNWNNDYAKLASLVRPPITTKQAEEAVQVLINCGLLQKDEAGNIKQADTVLTSIDIPAVYKRKQRREVMEKGIDAVESLSPEERHLSYTTLAVSEKTYQAIEEYLNTVRLNILDMAVKDSSVEKVYQLIFELFPFSKRLKGDEK